MIDYPKPTYVYFIGADNDAVKIGVTGDVEDRMNQLQTGHHQKLDIVATLSFPDRSIALEMENLLHAVLDDFCLEGEWFKISRSTATSDLERSASVASHRACPGGR